MNRIVISGKLGRDPEIVNFQDSGGAEATLTVSTPRFVKGREVTEWHKVVVKASSTVQNLIAPYARAGSKVTIVGELGYETFEKNGQKVRVAKIYVTEPKDFELDRTQSPKGQAGDFGAESGPYHAEIENNLEGGGLPNSY